MVMQYKEQRMSDELVIRCDSDWAGCKRTRKSTSGAVFMFGKHCLKTFSRTQDGIALSSGEAEFVAIVEAACTGLGIQAMLSDMGIKVKIRIMTDSSAAKSMVSRRGVGRVRHLDVKDAAFNTMTSGMKTYYQFCNKLLMDYVKLSGGEDVGLEDMAAEQLRKFLSRVGGEKLANTSWIVDGVICLLDWHVMVPFLECVTTCHLSWGRE